jgi:hypothetical protein
MPAQNQQGSRSLQLTLEIRTDRVRNAREVLDAPDYRVSSMTKLDKGCRANEDGRRRDNREVRRLCSGDGNRLDGSIQGMRARTANIRGRPVRPPSNVHVRPPAKFYGVALLVTA